VCVCVEKGDPNPLPRHKHHLPFTRTVSRQSYSGCNRGNPLVMILWNTWETNIAISTSTPTRIVQVLQEQQIL